MTDARLSAEGTKVLVQPVPGGTISAQGLKVLIRRDRGPVSYVDGTSMPPAETLGWWDGAAIQPVEILGWWDGDSIEPLG